MLKINNFTKKFGDKTIVNNLSLHIKPGEIYGFIGHNGAGKTTTIKSVVGINDFNEGEIFINGMSIKENPLECKKIIAYVPDNPDIYDYMTGQQYLDFISDIFCIPSDLRKEKISKYADLFGIEHALPQLTSEFSHGMKQKLVLISALIHDPKLLVMDEPFVGLDPKSSFDLKKIMREFCDNGSSIFFSSHVLEVVEKLCDKVAVIKQGEIIKTGTVDEVKGDESLEEAFLELEE